jgi:hypothetical protein
MKKVCLDTAFAYGLWLDMMVCGLAVLVGLISCVLVMSASNWAIRLD